MAKDSDISEASGYHLNAMGVFMSILVVSTILFTGATNKGANNKSQKRPRGDNAVTSKQSSTFLGFLSPLRVPLLGNELTKRESIELKRSTGPSNRNP
jgi:hypothetical protein